MVSLIETLFPSLNAGNHRVTSPQTDKYNCIAWAAGATDKWWWPIGDSNLTHWPVGVPKEETLAAFLAAFAMLGYTPCDSAVPEAGFEKVALFADSAGAPRTPRGSFPTGVGRAKSARSKTSNTR